MQPKWRNETNLAKFVDMLRVHSVFRSAVLLFWGLVMIDMLHKYEEFGLVKVCPLISYGNHH